MAGMEHLEIHSKVGWSRVPCILLRIALTFRRQSYLVRWVHVEEDHSISWSIQPKKRTIQFGIFKHPGSTTSSTPKIPSSSTLGEISNEAQKTEPPAEHHDSDTSLSDHVNSPLAEKFQKLGMKQVAWQGRCDANRVTMGQHDVKKDEAGMYGLVFDNTYSKQFSKTVTFVLMTYPTSAPPASGSNTHMALSQALAGSKNRRVSPSKRGSYIQAANSSNEHLSDSEAHQGGPADTKAKPAAGTEFVASSGASFYTGVLSKRRRKRNQGYAKRFFSLDFTSSTLSYYKNRNSSALRGSIPLSLAAIGADAKSKHISVDSGAEVWLLRAHNQHDFDGWRNALERATEPVQSPAKAGIRSPVTTFAPDSQNRSDAAEDKEWEAVEALVSRVSGITDAVRRIAKDTDPKYMPNALGQDAVDGSTASSTPADQQGEEYFSPLPTRSQRQPFWRRKSSTPAQLSSNALSRTVSGGRLAPPSPDALVPIKTRDHSPPKRQMLDDSNVHERCMAVLRDLDSAVSNFSALLAQSKERRFPPTPVPDSRHSFETTRSEDFYDAEEGRALSMRSSRVLDISRDKDDADETESVDSASTISNHEPARASTSHTTTSLLFPSQPSSLYPLPHASVHRRGTIPPAKAQPPSLFAFVRKNVGKDLSTIAMPVTANEPLSLLQKYAEPMEYAHLLTSACALSDSSETTASKRLLLVSTFALTALTSSRAKERAVRKPFNPMLGETFETVREDLGFRFIAEKVSHHPVRIACQADGGASSTKTSGAWSYVHAPAPSQKFWGKSAELITDGSCRVSLHALGERYTWQPAHAFLRNIVAGEKYLEPVGAITVSEETSGRHAIITFKASGLFSGRSEDVSIALYDGVGRTLPLNASGTWTSQITSPSGETLWKANPLPSDSSKKFGFTSFAATLNEVTELESGVIPPTDSRIRPDQRQYEEGDVNAAEDMKVKLEEGQRKRRKEREGRGEEWSPRFFEKVNVQGVDEEVWKMKGGEENYWEKRRRVESGAQWGVESVFET
ncbi:MAG: hypothetical protein Q9162_003887 [Coniocarpon cinnabarinum]